jgi:hypothetical protein
MCDKNNVIISKVHYDFTFFLKLIHIFRHKIYYNMNILKSDNINVKYDFTFKVHLQSKKTITMIL